MGVEHFLHVSALGAEEDSPIRWLSTKAKGEAALKSVFPTATIIRPARLFGPEDRLLNWFAQVRFFFFPPTHPPTHLPIYSINKSINHSSTHPPTHPHTHTPTSSKQSADSFGVVPLFNGGEALLQPTYVSDVVDAMVKIIEVRRGLLIHPPTHPPTLFNREERATLFINKPPTHPPYHP